jgi:hypothetical protein
MKLLFIAWVSWLMLTTLYRVVRRVKVMRSFYAKRETICFRYEPFLWMRRIF